jgi:hypothetical protein
MPDNSILPLSLRQMQEIGYGSDDCQILEYDFSKIPVSQYYPFFYSLPNIIYKKSTQISFTTRLQFEQKQTGNNQFKSIINDSISVNKPQYIRYLMKIIRKTLMKSKFLTKLSFHSIQIPPIVYNKFINHLRKFRSLNYETCKKVSFPKKQFRLLIKGIGQNIFNPIEKTNYTVGSAKFDSNEDLLNNLQNQNGRPYFCCLFNIQNVPVHSANIIIWIL